MIAEWDHCTQIALEPPSIEQTVGSGPVPVAAGGAITDGTYVLNSYSVFGASALTEDTRAGVLRFAAPAYQIRRGGLAVSGTFTTATTELSLTATCACPAAVGMCNSDVEMATYPYTATATQVVLFTDYINGCTAVSTYTKQ